MEPIPNIKSENIPLTEERIVGGKYKVDALLGKGGMGDVYRATNIENGMVVAVKTIREELNSPDLRDRLKIEAQTAGKLEHPYIQQVIDYIETPANDGNMESVYVMKDIMGKPLNQVHLSLDKKVDVLLQVAQGLDYANSKKVLHRDLKPGNFLVANESSGHQEDFFGCLSDFGVTHSSEFLEVNDDTLYGTPPYMSREHAKGEQIPGDTEAADFALAVFKSLTDRTIVEFSEDTTIHTPIEIIGYMAELNHLPPKAEEALKAKFKYSGEQVIDVFNKALADPKNPYKHFKDPYSNATKFMLDLRDALTTELNASNRYSAVTK